MIDFHTHILPDMDDGARSVDESLQMLAESRRQGIDVVFSTSHFYANIEDPSAFLIRRAEAFRLLRSSMDNAEESLPQIKLGAEILYFPGMSGAEELAALIIEDTDYLLVEPPMMPWTDSMLDEIEQTGDTLSCIPVIAHIDRYMRLLGDASLFKRVAARRMLAQVNAGFFIHPDSASFALGLLAQGRLCLIGSDCHNMSSRAPNMALAAAAANSVGLGVPFERLVSNDAKLSPCD